MLHADTIAEPSLAPVKVQEKLQVHQDSDRKSVAGSIRSRVSRILHLKGSQRAATVNEREISGDESDSASSASSDVSQPATPMLDPSTNTNPLAGEPGQPDEHLDDGRPENEKKRKKRSTDVSKHTFYIVNAQMRLKLFARNEVR